MFFLIYIYFLISEIKEFAEMDYVRTLAVRAALHAFEIVGRVVSTQKNQKLNLKNRT